MSDFDQQAELALKAAPLPTRSMLKHRRNIFIQLLRFIAINIKMIRVIWASHRASHPRTEPSPPQLGPHPGPAPQ